eukprot:755226-Hanusia_phi.AAC.3
MEKLRKAKRLARSEIKLSQWNQYNFAALDLDEGAPAKSHVADVLTPRNFSAGARRRKHRTSVVSRTEHSGAGDEPVKGCDEMSQDFIERFEIPCKPCVITGLLDRLSVYTLRWPAMHKWSFPYFAEKYGAARFKCGEDDDGYKVKLRLDYFAHYLRNGAKLDDSPLYVFDADFGDEGKVGNMLLEGLVITRLGVCRSRNPCSMIFPSRFTSAKTFTRHLTAVLRCLSLLLPPPLSPPSPPSLPLTHSNTNSSLVLLVPVILLQSSLTSADPRVHGTQCCRGGRGGGCEEGGRSSNADTQMGPVPSWYLQGLAAPLP